MSDKSTDNRVILQGLACDASNPDELRRALDEALDYRGDVSITRMISDTLASLLSDIISFIV